MICLAATESSLLSSPARPSVTLTRTTRTRRPSLSSAKGAPSLGKWQRRPKAANHKCIFSDFLLRVPYICYHPFTQLEGKTSRLFKAILTPADPGSPSMCSPTPSSRSPSSAPSLSTATSWWSPTRSKYTGCDVLWLFGALNFSLNFKINF